MILNRVMKKFRYIAVLVMSVFAACAKLDITEPVPDVSGDAVQIVGRVVSFTGCDVVTRAGKTVEESSTYSMYLAVFSKENKCKDVKYSSGSNITFSVAKSYLENGDQLYVFANIPEPDNDTYKRGVDLSEFMKITASVPGIGLPTLNVDGKDEKCLPMVGSYTIQDKNNLPQIIPIPLETVYAKIVCTIHSIPDQKIDGFDLASFTLDGFEVHNVASTVDFTAGTPGVTNDNVGVSSVVFEGELDAFKNNVAQGVDSVQFSFYLPERFLKPVTAAEDFTYPFGEISDLDTDEARRYPQRFKPLLVEGRNATFVRFYGEYIDHQTHNYNVSYDIYLGEDNYGNFDIVRNKQYNNTITIRGVTTSQDATSDDQSISIDHRVNVTRVQPIIINLRRETELDSHFEVRPLRIRRNPNYTGNQQNASVKVEVIYTDQAGEEWIGLERSFGNGVQQTVAGGTYLVESELQATNRTNAAGKRRYFTTNLTTEVLGTLVENIPVTDDGECVWIYVDEAKVANARDAMRSAIIRVSYLVNGAIYGDPIDYVINQHELFPVTFTNGTPENTADDWNYLIEYHEEYLHNYDADDSFGQTDYEGMQWGLIREQLSTELDAILISKGSWSSVDTDVKNKLKDYTPKYDFYLLRDIDRNKWSFQNDNEYNNLVHAHNGYEFNQKIINAVSSIGAKTLAQDPESAIEYCYNRNKRQPDGTIATDDFVWYLPAIDEMEEIVMSTYGSENYSYSRFTDFRAKMYWSCQPSYLNNFVWVERLLGDRYGNYMIDDVLRARATSVEYFNTTGNGASDPDNYEPKPSGSIGYTKYINGSCSILGRLSNMNELDVTGNENFTGSNNSENIKISLSTSAPEAGNLHRKDDKARVRCVRKR